MIFQGKRKGRDKARLCTEETSVNPFSFIEEACARWSEDDTPGCIESVLSTPVVQGILSTFCANDAMHPDCVARAAMEDCSSSGVKSIACNITSIEKHALSNSPFEGCDANGNIDRAFCQEVAFEYRILYLREEACALSGIAPSAVEQCLDLLNVKKK